MSDWNDPEEGDKGSPWTAADAVIAVLFLGTILGLVFGPL